MIVVKETSISQSESTIYITLQIPVKFELYASPLYISLNASPYFYEIDLGERIDPDSSKVVVEDGSVRIQLEKVVKGNWDQIKYKGTSIEVRERREMSRREEEERQAHIKKTEISRKRADERELVKRQMAVEGEMRTRVMELKKSEAEKASNSIMEYATSSGGMVGLDTTLPALNPSSSPSPSPSVPTLQSILDCSEDSDSDIDLEIIKARIRPPKHAPPRQTTTTKIKVKFSNRGLIPTTTARESEDVKWMTRIKLVKAMEKYKETRPSNSGGDSNEDGEGNGDTVEGLKQKGAQFFQLGDFKAALNAYSQAIALDSTDASLYANRAAVYLKLRDIKANEDCSRALEIIMREKDLLKEMGQDDGRDVVRTRMQVKVLTRRGICKAELMGDLVNGAKDYEMALKLDPGNAGLCRDAELLQTRLQAA